MSDALRADEFDLMLSTLRYVLGAGQAKNGEKASDHYNAIINSIASRAERTEDADVRLACAAVKRAALAQPPAPTAQPAPMSQPNRLIAYSAAAKLREIGYVWDEKSGKWEAAQPVQQPGAEPLHGGMDNAELLAAWKKKLPGVEPSDAQLTAFAVGVEVGFSHARDLERQDWSRVHHALAKHGVHPGRTDDHLADVIDRALAAPAQRQPLTVPALTDAQMSECAWGYVADSRNLDAGVTGIIQATQLACAAAWGITLAAQKGEKL